MVHILPGYHYQMMYIILGLVGMLSILVIVMVLIVATISNGPDY